MRSSSYLTKVSVHHIQGKNLISFKPSESAFCANHPVSEHPLDRFSRRNRKMVGLSSESVVKLIEELQEWEAGTAPEEREMSVVEWVMSLPRRRSSLSAISLPRGISWRRSSSSLEASMKFEKLISPSTISVLAEDSSLKSRPGWPLLRIKTLGTMDSSTESEDSSACFSDESEAELRWTHLKQMGSSACKRFTYEMLDESTNHFSPGNLVGEGGCSTVYKGRLPDGKVVAVKVLKQYKEARTDFSLEVEIMASVNHRHITPLVGACSEEHSLMLVYEFMSEGSLEERLQDHSNDRSSLPWQARFRVAVAVAEALNYLHNECARPIIHRDVKSSNILLSGQSQPQLSDFGLAMWGPLQSTYATHSDIVGTFGYIAPEYFMDGRVSEKTDVYSYGVVLLELLTGRKAISSKGQENLVKWAMPFLEKGNLNSLLDPKLTVEVNIPEVQRTVLAAVLCTKQSPRLRPNANQILELLRGEQDVRHWVNAQIKGIIASDKLDDTCPDIDQCQPKPYPPDLSILELDGESFAPEAGLDISSKAEVEHNPRLKLKDYLEEPLD